MGQSVIVGPTVTEPKSVEPQIGNFRMNLVRETTKKKEAARPPFPTMSSLKSALSVAYCNQLECNLAKCYGSDMSVLPEFPTTTLESTILASVA